MDTLTELQKELNSVKCPQCQKSRFDLTLRCELAYKECLYTARCLNCGYTFNVSTEARDLLKREPEIEKGLSVLRCPACGKTGADLRFWCDLNQKTCLYVAACHHCGYISHHYR